MGSRKIQTVKGKRYLYYVVYENGKQRAIYCGPEYDPKSEKKFWSIDLEHLKLQNESIVRRIKETKVKIESF